MRHATTDPPPGLADLDSVTLLPEHEEKLARLRKDSLGSAAWRVRKNAEARDLLALEQVAPRMNLLALEGTTALRAIVRLRTTVPCLPPGADDLVVGDAVDLGLHYPEEILRGPLPGYALVEILSPREVHHPNVAARGPFQRLCLGVNVPRGYPLRECVLASYAALTLQSIMLDERDPAGVMNGEAARWWQSNSHRIPLSTVPFLASVRDERSGS